MLWINAMDKDRGVGAVVLVLLLIFTTSFFSMANGDNDDEEKSKLTCWLVWQRLRSSYSVYSKLISPTSIGDYWHLFKALLNQAYTYFFPPNIDFRRGGVEAQGVTLTENGAAGEKVKEALAKSLGTSKATLEDAAKSAADIAGETIVTAKQKVKLTLSDQDRQQKPQKEL